MDSLVTPAALRTPAGLREWAGHCARRAARVPALLGGLWLAAAAGAAEAQERPVPGFGAVANADTRLDAFTAIARGTAGALRIAIEYPERGQPIVGSGGRGFLTGTAFQSRRPSEELYDVIVAIDVSSSTQRPSGADIDGDGRIGDGSFARKIPLVGTLANPASSDPGDSVLACEVKAAKTLLAQLDSETTRVGIIAFSGSRGPRGRTEPDARVVVPLTSDYDALAQGLDALEAEGPQDETNLLAAVQRATVEFEREAIADPQRRVQRLVILISDGRPTLPEQLPPRERASAAIDAARDAAQIQVRFDTYAVGRDESISLSTLREIAEVTEGRFERVGQPADLVARFQALALAEISELQIRNLTMGRETRDILVDPYGLFSAVVPLADGANELEIFARSTEGVEQRELVNITYVRADGPEVLPVRALERRARLLEERLRATVLADMERARRERSVNVESVP